MARFTQALLEKSRSKVEILQRLNSAESEATAKARSEVAALQNRPVHRSKLSNSRSWIDFFSFKGGAVRYDHKGRVKWLEGRLRKMMTVAANLQSDLRNLLEL